LKTIVTYYKGILRSQFATHYNKELGNEHRKILSHIRLEPTFELHAAEVISEEEFHSFQQAHQESPYIRVDDRIIVEYFNQADAIDGKRMYADVLFMGLERDPVLLKEHEIRWDELKLDSVPSRYLHECFIAYANGTNHGRICGPVVLKRIQQVDETGVEVFEKADSDVSRAQTLERQGWFQSSRGCTSKFFAFNTWLKNWLNSIFSGIFGANLFGNEPNGCLPSLFPSGCTGVGCQRFGCGILSLLASLAFLVWLVKFLFFGGPDTSNVKKDQVVERIVHDTIYIEKNSKVDTVTYVDETTNTTVKMLSLPNVQFEKNKSILLRSSIPQLNQLAAYLLENKEIKAEIIGHTDSDGDAVANRKLSQGRAEAVRQYLIQNGVQGWRVKATGKGESEPITENKTAEGRAMNRRVEVKLSQSNTTKTTRTREERHQE
jgi:outer membrane protein OmpA-like peptidoglycan-associated protein